MILAALVDAFVKGAGVAVVVFLATKRKCAEYRPKGWFLSGGIFLQTNEPYSKDRTKMIQSIPKGVFFR